MGFELLPKDRDGSLVLGETHFQVGEQEGMLFCEFVDGSRWDIWVHMPLRGQENWGGVCVPGKVPRTQGVERLGEDLDRVFEREKRGASVHRRKRERCLACVPVTGKGRESGKALWRRAEHKECGDVGGARGRGPHTTRLTRN